MHKCFISYHKTDEQEVSDFVTEFDEGREVFIARAIGVSQDIIDSDDSNYIMRKVREKYLTDSTVTIVMIGRCTWSRRFVDWEIASSLRNDPNNKRSGLMAITLPSVSSSSRTLPARLKDNWKSESGGYARWWKYPSSATGLEDMIEEAYDARDTLGHLVDNSRRLFGSNRDC
ncbi:MAG: TIR domain-containing protein [Acidobacteria bacterium]|nr:TIR domain-containing protein [Acidobacteriota bacterium]